MVSAEISRQFLKGTLNTNNHHYCLGKPYQKRIFHCIDLVSFSDFVVVGTFPRCTPSRPGHECLRCTESYNSSWRLTADRSRTTSERSEGQLKSLGQRSPEVFTKRVRTEVEQEENVDNDDEPRSRESACSPARHEDQPSEM